MKKAFTIQTNIIRKYGLEYLFDNKKHFNEIQFINHYYELLKKITLSYITLRLYDLTKEQSINLQLK